MGPATQGTNGSHRVVVRREDEAPRSWGPTLGSHVPGAAEGGPKKQAEDRDRGRGNSRGLRRGNADFIDKDALQSGQGHGLCPRPPAQSPGPLHLHTAAFPNLSCPGAQAELG